ncbi:MAG: nucleotidyltransferase family protein [Proteobacteria bacterium]|nr:nucleotidyltransferase family protein [Pseudomonadota bacterium]
MTGAAIMPRSAMLLAAGLGKRMRPLTDSIPKPMVPFMGRPLIDHALDRLAEAGVKRAVVNLHYFPNQIRNHLANRTDIEIVYSDEPELLETGGGVKKALPLLGDAPFFAVNSDAIWLNGGTDTLGRLAELWNSERMDALLLLQSTVDAHGYHGPGDFTADPDGRVARRAESEVTPWLFAGVEIIDPKAFADTPDGPFSLNVIFDRTLRAGRLYGMVHDGEWFHIGSPEGLAEAETFMNDPYPGDKKRT